MVNNNYMRLCQWAALHGMHRMTAWRHYNAGTLPTELQPKKIGNIIYVLAHPGTPPGRIAGYARVSSAGQKPHLENQANRLWAHAGQNRMPLDQVVSEVASGLNDRRPKLRRLLGDPTVIIERRERLARFGVGMVETMLQARGGSLVVIDDAEVPDDLVRDMTEILTCFCARLYGKRSAGGPWSPSVAELKGKKRKQPSSCPEGWAPGAVVVQLELTRRQEHYARRCAGISRFVYNRLVANDQAGRDTGLWLTPHELEKEFNAAKQVNTYLAFITEVSKFVAQGACRNYQSARSRWLNKELQARRPVFHKKNRTGAGSFLAASGVNRIRYDGHRRIRLPYLGSVRMTRKLPDGIPYEVSVKRQNGRWYASVAYWKTPALPPQRETQSVGGVDVGISPLAVDSGGAHPNPKAHYQPVRTANGQWRYPNPRGYAKVLKALTRRQRAQARRTPGSRGWWEAQRRIDRAHRRATGLRDNAHHHVSRALVRKYHTIGIETLNVSGMIRAGLQSKALADAGMSGLLHQVRYKAQWYGTQIVEAGQWFPSSKTCSVCGAVNGDLQREPDWDCPECGSHHDRNENAARNLLKLALLAVGEDVMLPDGKALADGGSVIGETGPEEGRTKQAMTVAPQLTLAA